MKISLLKSFVFLSIVAFCSCSKSNTTPSDPVAPNAIVGLWIGSQIPNDGSTTVPLYYSFEIKSDSTLLVQGQGADGNTYYSVGKWSLTGTAFTATITVTNLSVAGAKQNITATYNSTSGKLTSGIVQTIGVNYTAGFALDRVN